MLEYHPRKELPPTTTIHINHNQVTALCVVVIKTIHRQGMHLCVGLPQEHMYGKKCDFGN